jgi:MerR HTH family regulatory protein
VEAGGAMPVHPAQGGQFDVLDGFHDPVRFRSADEFAIVMHIRNKYHLPSHVDRPRAQGLLTTTELAQRLGVHPSTIKNWTKAGILNSHKANDKNERLYEPQSPTIPASKFDKAAR